MSFYLSFNRNQLPVVTSEHGCVDFVKTLGLVFDGHERVPDLDLPYHQYNALISVCQIVPPTTENPICPDLL